MSAEIAVVLTFGALIAYANGANDVSKSIATLVGSGVSDFQKAIVWGSFWTGAGGLSGLVLAGAMTATFGKGLLAQGIAPSFAAVVSTLAGAALWVLLANQAGMPVSTTHAIVGAIVGVSVVAYGPLGVNWSALIFKILLPLLASPLIALALTTVLIRVSKALVRNRELPDCVCAEAVASDVVTMAPGLAALSAAPSSALRVIWATQQDCAKGQPQAARVTMDHLHWLTSGGTAFARGLNDAPKIAALVIAASFLTNAAGLRFAAFFVIACAMVVGSLVAGRKVTEVLAHNVTRMDNRQGFFANLVTAALVGPGAALGLPMSTTHVSSGSIFGIGVQESSSGLNHETLRNVLLTWVVTLPGAAVLGIAALLLLHMLGGW